MNTVTPINPTTNVMVVGKIRREQSRKQQEHKRNPSDKRVIEELDADGKAILHIDEIV